MSLTSSERNALRWLTAVIAIGAGVKLYGQWSHAGAADGGARIELIAQLAAVDSAQRAGDRSRGRGRPRGGASGSAAGGPRTARSRPPRTLVDGELAALSARTAVQVPTLGPVDLDRADSAMLERLPRIGPALAARIVADRRINGDFGSLEALQRVRGIGPKLAQLLRAHVTFSGTPRHPPVQR